MRMKMSHFLHVSERKQTELAELMGITRQRLSWFLREEKPIYVEFDPRTFAIDAIVRQEEPDVFYVKPAEVFELPRK